jgi:hypothetical protein
MNDRLTIARAEAPHLRGIFAVAVLKLCAQVMRRPVNQERIDEMLHRAARGPAATGTPGYAAELTRETWEVALELMAPTSILASLPLHRVQFQGAARITVPARKPDAAHNLAGTWRAENDPIRVGSLSLIDKELMPRSLGVIGTYSREMLQRSSVVPLIERAMRRDTAIALDAAFLDDQVATVKRPAGLQTFATGGNTRPASGTDVASITTDLRACATAMVDAGCGTQPVWIMSIVVLQALMTLRDATGALAFPTLSASPPTLLTYPVTQSTTAPRDVVFLADCDELVLAIDDPTSDETEGAALHEEDTTPLPISSPDTPETITAPIRSLWQTAAAATRTLWSADWSVLTDGALQTITGTDGWLAA